MNRFERNFSGRGEARLRYHQNDYDVLVPGGYVTCAVTGAQIAIEDLRYWNAEKQEAYASPEIALGRYLELKGAGK